MLISEFIKHIERCVAAGKACMPWDARARTFAMYARRIWLSIIFFFFYSSAIGGRLRHRLCQLLRLFTFSSNYVNRRKNRTQPTDGTDEQRKREAEMWDGDWGVREAEYRKEIKNVSARAQYLLSYDQWSHRLIMHAYSRGPSRPKHSNLIAVVTTSLKNTDEGMRSTAGALGRNRTCNMLILSNMRLCGCAATKEGESTRLKCTNKNGSHDPLE